MPAMRYFKYISLKVANFFFGYIYIHSVKIYIQLKMLILKFSNKRHQLNDSGFPDMYVLEGRFPVSNKSGYIHKIEYWATIKKK